MPLSGWLIAVHPKYTRKLVRRVPTESIHNADFCSRQAGNPRVRSESKQKTGADRGGKQLFLVTIFIIKSISWNEKCEQQI